MLANTNFKAILKEKTRSIEAKKKEAENTLISVENFLSKKNFEKAKLLVFEKMNNNREQAAPIFKKYPPRGKKCPKCKNQIQPEFHPVYVEWTMPPCSNCQYLHIREKIETALPKIMQRRGIPRRFLDAELNNFPARYRKNRRPCYLHGPRGVGKTHFMAALMREEVLTTEPLKSKGRQGHIEYFEPNDSKYPLFLSVPELLLKIRATFSNQGNYSEEQILEKYSTVKALFLDDLGTEKPSVWATQTLFLLIDRRYGAMLPTFFSSNLTLDALSGRLDDRIASRIAGMCEVINMRGKDRRLK